MFKSIELVFSIIVLATFFDPRRAARSLVLEFPECCRVYLHDLVDKYYAARIAFWEFLFGPAAGFLRLLWVISALKPATVVLAALGIASQSASNAALRTVYPDRLTALGQLDPVIRS
ncbi:MAG: hypothetical protein ACEQSK_03125 [Sphingomonadaceae bacterium]